MPQIRLHKTPELEEVLAYLRGKYRVLSEAEIIKVALAEKYTREIGGIPLVSEEEEKLIAQGLKDYENGNFTELKKEEDIDRYLDSL